MTDRAAQADLLQNSKSLSGKQMRSLLVPGCRTAGRGLVPAEGVLQPQLCCMPYSRAESKTKLPDSTLFPQVGFAEGILCNSHSQPSTCMTAPCASAHARC